MAPWFSLLLCVFAFVSAARAEEPPPEYGARAQVRRDVRGPEVAASDFRIEPKDLLRVPRTDAQQLLTLVPGVLLTNHANEGHAATVFMRGFEAGAGENLETQLEGMPLNEVSNHHAHGYADTTFLVPELVRELRVVQGPFDPAQGDFAVAGSVDYRLGLQRPGMMLRASLGSYRRRRLFFGYRPSGERAGTFLAVNLERGDGFGIQRSFGKASAVGQYEAKLNASTYLRTLAFAAAQRWDTAGVLRQDDYVARRLSCGGSADAQLFCSYDPNQGGQAQRAGLTTVLERSTGSTTVRAQAFFGVRGFRTRENYTGFSQDPSIEGQQRGDLRDGRTDALTFGLKASGRRRFRAWEQEHAIEAGLVARHDIVGTNMDRIRRELHVPYMTDFDRDVRQTQLGVYGRADLQPWDRLRLSFGARADTFAYVIVDHNQPTEDRIGLRLSRESTDAYGFALSPRGTIDLTVLDGLHWITSVGAGARSSDATALSQSESAPFARIWGGETGLTYRIESVVDVEARLSAFYTRVSRDLVFDPESGRNQPAGTSQRIGISAMSRVSLTSWFDVVGSTSYTRAHLTEGANAWLSLQGPRVPFVPAWLVRSDAVVQHALPFVPDLSGFAALGLGVTGQRPLPQANWAAAYALLDASLGVSYRFAELALSVTNLLDARYRSEELHYASSWNPALPPSQVAARHFTAGAPRQWLATLTLYGF